MAQTLTDADIAQYLQQQNQQQSQQNGSLSDAQVATYLQQQQNPAAQVYQQQAQQQVPQIPITPGTGYGMNTMGAINANSMLGPDANKQAIAKNVEALGIPIDAAKAAATTQATGQEQNVIDAQRSIARDSANTNMMAGVGRQMMDYYDQADKAGLAGDKYRNFLGQNIANGSFPKELSSILPQSGAVGAYNAISNEWKTRMTPVMQEQFGKDGGSRIMDSMLQMADKEVPGLSQPRDVVQSQLKATIKNFVRFTFGTADYASRLGQNVSIDNSTPQNAVDSVAKKLWNMSSVALKPDIERKANDIAAYATKDSGYQFAKNPDTGEIAIKGSGDKKWRMLGQ